MPPDKGIQIPAFSRPLQFRGRGMRPAMVRHERVVAALRHNAFPIVAIQRDELPVSKPVLGQTSSESRDGTPGQPANGDSRSELPQQVHRGGPIAKGIEGPHGVFRGQRRHESIGHGLPDQLPHALMAQL